MKDAIFLGLNFQQFADITSGGIIALFILNIIFLILFFVNNFARGRIKPLGKIVNKIIDKTVDKTSYEYFVYILVFVLGLGIVGANIYEIVYGDKPCILCWYQRVMIYPMFILLISELYFKTRVAHKFVAVLAFLTAAIGVYHYRFHYIRYVLGDLVSVPCSGNPLMPTCGEAGVVSFGFMTMPLMSVVMGVFVITVCYILNKKSK